MKVSLSLVIISVIALSLFTVPSRMNGEVPVSNVRSEQDSIECLKRMSVSTLAIEKKMFGHAIDSWRSLFNNCPGMSLRIYSDGVKLWEHFIEQTSDNKMKEAYVDTLLMVYDKRIEYFGDHNKYPEGWILGRKGLDILRYRRGDSEAMKEAYACFQDSYELLQDETEASVLVSWLQTSRFLCDDKMISEQDFVNDFFTIYSHVSGEKFGQKYNSPVISKVNKAVTNIFRKADFLNCVLLEEIAGEMVNVSNIESQELKLYLDAMEIGGCKETAFYTSLIERNYSLQPSSEAARDLARLFLRKGRYNRAANYYHEAIEKCLNDSLKAIYYYELGVLTDGHFNKPMEARQYAKRASALLPTWGKPHLLLGGIYARAASSIEGNELEQNAVYWAAVDQFLKAKQNDSACREEANQQIEVYKKYFPNQQTCFFHGLDEGQTFVVGDWINEPTTVRYR